ncbi:hypothetical protein EOA27_29450 [Mesorhizobium sp. M2A.F.Ca.ET.037.01.1.1]|uniref:hypothetical protein n=1 Tax=unclassified Mesorhizobium TaxID=325217 RepID=UPI000F75AE79|nr:MULTISPECIES: hypothetical protein [unclassified Mesorhizobium]RVC58112.1 hypothetical protein EN766_40860 [Mesorhizobium sp. M2A.F.Ca.ET.046.02.1.1]RVC59031.1 hypothetical protein EN759_33210 [Mesorhizobium sp. M00.F.Ca.ET.038.03.1.1]AZO06526.1 hypothetical protein EJ068_28265 [Mesorhizobium sp. M2A.F.Ca.ET.043.02.1.1]AZO39146.1 hypothetical protein EJ072_35330 [Mesorhizobium sp. M2A.F.Ca.ET.046.03.2.1]RUW68230.1 hypothetical protein EOA28_27635 [Mesorhizobium sp. M2A.F.Ca.ET.067.02.1.1]
MFAPLDMHGEKRADLHRAARLSMLHERVVKRFDRVDHSADAVETAAAAFVEITHRPAVFVAPFRPNRRPETAAGWTLGL